MLTVETIGRIRREHFIKGKTIREIARDLKVSRNTVRKVLRSRETSFEYERDIPATAEAWPMDGRARRCVVRQCGQAGP
jgi:predicted transcriptional regulator